MIEIQMPEPLLTAKDAKAVRGCASDSTLWISIKEGSFPPPDTIIKRVRYWKPSTLRKWQDVATMQADMDTPSEHRSLITGDG
jgi:predicted DNA-binding transcriptional regulator AlpA